MDRTRTQELLIAAASALAGQPFTVDKDNEKAVEAIACWLARERGEGVDPNKGMLLIGNVGSGKSLLMRAASKVISDAYGVRAFGVKGCADFVRLFNAEGYDGEIDRWINGEHVCLDDLGTEGEAIHFGKRTNLIGEMIEARYDRAMRGLKSWTNITTNLDTDQIKERYGMRVYSRIAHLCNPIEVGASDKAVDRRRSARAMVPIESPNADNIYSVIHPRIASRLLESIRPVIDAMKAPPTMIVVPQATSQSADLERYAVLCRDASTENLEAERKAILLNNTPGASAPFVAIIDAELARIREKSEVTHPIVNPAAA